MAIPGFVDCEDLWELLFGDAQASSRLPGCDQDLFHEVNEKTPGISARGLISFTLRLSVFSPVTGG